MTVRMIEFTDSFYPIMDGVGNVVYQYAMQMAGMGHECYVVAPQTDTGFRGRFPFELVDYVGVTMPMMKSYKVGAPQLDIHCHNRLNMISADIVHVHSPFVAGQMGVSYAQKRGLPVVGTFHSKYYDDFLQVTGMRLAADVGVKYVVGFYDKCTEVWAVSESSAETLRGYGYEGAIRVMPNGTDVRPLENSALRGVSETFSLSGDPLLLYVGQINWKKNLRLILEACAGLRKPFQLVFAGQGPHEKEVLALARQLNILDRVRLVGHVADTDALNALYARADLFVFPSLYDTSGLVVREAAAMGTPSVVTRGSSAAEVIEDGVNGFEADDTAEDLRAVIEQALSDPTKLQRIGARAKGTIPIPWEELVRDVLERYQEIIDQYV